MARIFALGVNDIGSSPIVLTFNTRYLKLSTSITNWLHLGRLAQRLERLSYKELVKGSIPLSPLFTILVSGFFETMFGQCSIMAMHPLCKRNNQGSIPCLGLLFTCGFLA